MILIGKTLGKRQLELNSKVNEAATKKVIFDDVKEQIEKSDVDKLFKIDLASKYKNVDYIVEVLKSGDSLYISRALKCLWIYDDEYSNIVNPDYLHNHVFPYMSIKMKKKMLATLPLYVRNEERAASFYMYCMNAKMTTYAFKYLRFTTESLKKDAIENNINFLNDLEPKNLRFFIGNMFELAKAFLDQTAWKNKALYDLRYLYSVSDVKYLELLEKHASMFGDEKNLDFFGLRLSNSIIKLYKQKILNYPVLYVNILNKSVLIKHSSIDDLKSYALGLLPKNCDEFWNMNYCKTYKHILNAISAEERFEFIKKIFTHRYQKPFDMSIEFYNEECYKYMTIQEREDWALRHLASKEEILGVGNDYMWYKFISFDNAFPEIKKYVLITTDIDKRANIVEVLIESARNQRELEKLLNYYYERHVNELRYKKEIFLNEVTSKHRVFDFDENCWAAFNKVLYSLDVYNPSDQAHNLYRYKILALVYYIINNKEFPTGLQQYVVSRKNAFAENGLRMHHFQEYVDQLDKERKESVYQYVMKSYVDKISKFENVEYNIDVKYEVRDYVTWVQDLMKYFKKPNEDCPEIVKKYMKLDAETFYPEKPKTITPAELLRLLKQDAVQISTELPVIKYSIEHSWEYKLNQLIRKLRIYFKHDIAQDYLESFIKWLSESESHCQRNIFAAVHGIFQLADDKAKSDFMSKYAPANSKIDHSTIDRTVMYIQEAICRFACYSRPPVPLSNLNMYIKGDYLRYCLPMFYLYASNLPLPLCMQFIESLLNSPVSVQKHGLRLVFYCFNIENIKRLLINAWTKTKNVSLRKVIYTSLYNHMVKQDQMKQVELYEALKMFALSVHQDDDKDVLVALANGRSLHKYILGDYLETAWITLNKLTDNDVILRHKVLLVHNIDYNIKLVSKNLIRKIIDEHVNIMLVEKKIQPNKERDRFDELDNAKWQLVAKYIVKYVEDEENSNEVLEFVKFIIKKCLEMWNDVHYNHKTNTESYTLRKVCHEFIENIMSIHFKYGKESYVQINTVLEAILSELHTTLPIHETYKIEWYLKLAMITNKVFEDGKVQYIDDIEHKRMVTKVIARNYALGLGNLVTDFIERKLYFTSYSSHISDMVKDNLIHILNISASYSHDILVEDLCVFVGVSLMSFKMKETVLIALNILPVHSSPTSDVVVSSKEYKKLIYDIKMFDNNEVQCLLYEKVSNNNFMKDLY